MIVVQTIQAKNSTWRRYTSDCNWLTTYPVSSAEYILRGKMIDCTYSTSSPGLVHGVFSSIMAGVGKKESSLDSLEARQFRFPKQSLQFKGHYGN